MRLSVLSLLALALAAFWAAPVCAGQPYGNGYGGQQRYRVGIIDSFVDPRTGEEVAIVQFRRAPQQQYHQPYYPRQNGFRFSSQFEYGGNGYSRPFVNGNGHYVPYGNGYGGGNGNGYYPAGGAQFNGRGLPYTNGHY